ncbi:MmgE/PrpD family protein [Pyramidobacter sp.]|uniref:MmgE/PrpD family protein n=1 Tax=Pyramidobacter sp. TaxID=1943581 RepID=UPI0025FC4F39|nr:MmgE/PrpD family protein [Pyramidobacter sp.]MCI7402933.1 MmgE/PrpD family protein [Pyramidobacter sp.]MDY3212323.1 MmgE/PrpD family protein [Pyramidobacter sp.]
MNNLAQQLAEYIVTLRYDSLPSKAVDSAKQCILDSTGNMLYGCCTAVGEKAKAHIKAFPGGAKGSLVFVPGGDSFPADDAAFISTLMARSSDLDDGHRVAMGHPGSFLIPAVMAYGQVMNANGKEMLTAVIAGYETYIRIGETINPSSYRERGFESTSVTGSVACTAALGKLYNLDASQMKDALGLAATFTGGLIEYQNDGSMGKVLSGAWAIRNATMSLQLALSGFTGPEAIFEGKKGFAQAFSNHPEPEKAVAELGSVFKISEIYFKAHACMRGLHCAIDAVLDLRERFYLTPENIDSIIVYTTPFVGRLSKPCPRTEISAQNSLEFTMAVALKNGHIASERVLAAAMKQSDVFATAQKIKLVMDPEVSAFVQAHPSCWGSVRVSVGTKDGQTHETFVSLPRGEAENPFSWEELKQKFCRMTENTPYQPYASELAERLAHFEELSAPGNLYHPWNESRITHNRRSSHKKGR